MVAQQERHDVARNTPAQGNQYCRDTQIYHLRSIKPRPRVIAIHAVIGKRTATDADYGPPDNAPEWSTRCHAVYGLRNVNVKGMGALVTIPYRYLFYQRSYCTLISFQEVSIFPYLSFGCDFNFSNSRTG